MIRILRKVKHWAGCLMLLMMAIQADAQQVVINLSGIDGMDITPDNVLNYQADLLLPNAADALVKGVIKYRNSDLRIDYQFKTRLQPGSNSFTGTKANPEYRFSSSALRELFLVYKFLPFGTYQYCVSITLTSGENGNQDNSECLFRQSEDQFMISLIDPDDNAKLYEYHPQLSWLATYSFSSELTYRIRVAEIKQGQNNAAALSRNNPVYEEKNLLQNSTVYPIYAKPLKPYQPYAWTVDAYYKGVLLGGAAPWRFTIIEDSINKTLPRQSSYIDLNVDEGTNRYYAVGNIKLKYAENDFLQNELTVKILRNGKELKTKGLVWNVTRGENFQTYDLTEFGLKHKEDIEMIVQIKNEKTNANTKKILFKYVDPTLVN